MFGCVVYCSAREADQATNGRAVYDGTASLLTHLAQLVLHAVPDAAEIDRVHAIEFFAAGISGFNGRRLHASVVVRRIQATEGGYRLLDHCCHLTIIAHVAAKSESLTTGGFELRCLDTHRFLLDVRQHD